MFKILTWLCDTCFVCLTLGRILVSFEKKIGDVTKSFWGTKVSDFIKEKSGIVIY